MILTTYLDAAGTHGGDGTDKNPASPTVVMAGKMGTAGQWRRFEHDYNVLRKKCGFTVFHMVDFKQPRGEFRGWTNDKRAAFLRDILPVIGPGRFMEGVSCRIDVNAYDSQYIGQKRPSRPQLDTIYGLCFRNCVFHMLLEAERRLGHHRRWPETRIHFVLENDQKNGDAQRIFEEVRDYVEVGGYNNLGYLSYGTKKICMPLIIGDLLSYTTWWMDQVQRKENLPMDMFFGDSSREGQSSLSHITYTPEGLANVRAQLIQNSQRRKRK